VSGGLRQNLSGLAHDALTLVELQFRLLGVDLRDARRGIGFSLAGMAVGMVLVLGCIPILMLAGAQALVEFLHWPASAAYAAVGVAAAVLAILLLRWGWGGMFRSLQTVERSRAEFSETLRWLKNSLKESAACATPSGTRSRVRHWRM